ncbi:hypothetical protein K8O68_05860 [Salipaludibacillus sp. CUR1]|nr:hypothetical protein [Salipaludibacillus sp. CUR1]MCE7791944.1 hypothetical protein [Salipaludibacillus sp. CUR1]
MNETGASMRLVNNAVLSENGIRRLKDSIATIIEPAHYYRSTSAHDTSH